jgi:DNA polymerase phi
MSGQESTLDENEGPNGTKSALGNWKPQVHFVWGIILDQLLSNPKSANLSRASFQEFFRLVVDGSLDEISSSIVLIYHDFQSPFSHLHRPRNGNTGVSRFSKKHSRE